MGHSMSGADDHEGGDINVPEILWGAGYRHPDHVATSLTDETLAELIQRPLDSATRILSICEQYSSRSRLWSELWGFTHHHPFHISYADSWRNPASTSEDLQSQHCCLKLPQL